MRASGFPSCRSDPFSPEPWQIQAQGELGLGLHCVQHFLHVMRLLVPPPLWFAFPTSSAAFGKVHLSVLCMLPAVHWSGHGSCVQLPSALVPLCYTYLFPCECDHTVAPRRSLVSKS